MYKHSLRFPPDQHLERKDKKLKKIIGKSYFFEVSLAKVTLISKRKFAEQEFVLNKGFF